MTNNNNVVSQHIQVIYNCRYALHFKNTCPSSKLSDILALFGHIKTKPLGMQASIFDACAKPG